ncbi:MAG: protein translocase subunit SecF [Angustibacter sp.]
MVSFARFGNQLYSGERSLQIVRRRRTWYAISAVLLLLSIVALGLRGLSLGLDFTGGSEFRVSNPASTSDLPGVEAVGSVLPQAEARVTQVGGTSVRVQISESATQQVARVQEALARAYDVPESNITVSTVGPSWGASVSRSALWGLIVFLVLVSVFISVYFRTWKMALAAIVALVHDLVITVGIYALVGFEVTPASVIGFLTILGYSLYDTVVVFDKVRENTDRITTQTRQTYSEAANLAVNQTVVRSINTSVVALLPVAAILFIGAFLLGAGTLRDLSLSLFVGIATGAYSSIFIATPLLAGLREREPQMRLLHKRVMGKRAEAPGPMVSPGRAGRGPVPAPSTGTTATAVLDRSGHGTGNQSGSSSADLSDRPGQDLRGGDGVATVRAAGQRLQPRRKNTRRKR